MLCSYYHLFHNLHLYCGFVSSVTVGIVTQCNSSLLCISHLVLYPFVNALFLLSLVPLSGSFLLWFNSWVTVGVVLPNLTTTSYATCGCLPFGMPYSCFGLFTIILSYCSLMSPWVVLPGIISHVTFGSLTLCDCSSLVDCSSACLLFSSCVARGGYQCEIFLYLDLPFAYALRCCGLCLN